MSNLLKFVLIADDTNIFCSSTSLHDLQYTINRELAKLFVWFSVNRFSLNLGKTNYMLFNSRPPDNVLELIIMAGMAVVLRGWLPHRGEGQMASPRGQCSK